MNPLASPLYFNLNFQAKKKKKSKNDVHLDCLKFTTPRKIFHLHFNNKGHSLVSEQLLRKPATDSLPRPRLA